MKMARLTSSVSFLLGLILTSTSVFANVDQMPKCDSVQTGKLADLWVYSDSIDAEVFKVSIEFQTRQLSLIFDDKNVKEIITKQNENLLPLKRVLTVKGVGCGANASSKTNGCEITFVLGGLNPTDAEKTKVFARLFAKVNVATRVVSSIHFQLEN